ncbi:MAG: exosome complex RNA-binding protein Rrp4 [Candidatus Bathyarchaeia archaeon]
MPQRFENRELVVPGDVIADGGFRPGENTYRLHGKIYAARIGLVDYERGFASVIALKANYAPRVGDNVIGMVVEIDLGSWSVDIGATSMASLNVPDALGEPFKQEMVMPDFLDVGEVIVARVVDMNRDGTPILSTLGPDLGKVEEGRMVKMTPSKIPRLIGKKGSMVKMILKETGCEIIIGQNGTILVNSKDREMEDLVVQIIQKIEGEAHTTGLTNRIYEFIKEIKEGRKE